VTFISIRLLVFFFQKSEFESKEGAVIRLETSGDLKDVDKRFSLFGETVDDILLVVSDGSFEEETQIRENWAHGFTVDLHPGEELSEDNHVDHEGGSQERVLTDVVGGDGVDTVHEDRAGVLIEGTLRVLNKWDVLDDNFVIDFVVSLWV